MSNRIISYTSKSYTHPYNFCNYMDDSVVHEILNNDPEAKIDIDSWFQYGQNYDMNGYLVTDGLMSGFEELINEEAYSLANSMDYLHHPNQFFNGIINFDMKDVVGDLFFSDSILNKSGHIIGYADKRTPDRLPVHVHLAKKVQEYLLYELQKKTNIVVVSVRCSYDVDDDYVVSLDVAIYYEGSEFEYVTADLEEDISKNNIGLSDDMLKKFYIGKQENDTVLDLTIRGNYNDDKRIHSGRSISSSPYGPEFSSIKLSGKDMCSVQRGGSAVARYIARNIIETERFDNVTVHLDYNLSKHNPRPDIFIKARMFGYADVEFDFPEHASKEINENFPTLIEEARDAFGEVSYQDLARYGEYGEYDNGLRPWEQINKTDVIDNIKM